MADVEPIAIVRAEDGYRGLLDAFRKRRDQLNVRGLVLDGIAGLADGHTGKLHAGTKLFGHASFGPMLGSHAVMLVMIEDAEALDAIKGRLVPRDEKQVMRGSGAHRKWTIEKSLKELRKMGRLGALATNSKLTPKQRSKSARRAANARWKREREQREATRNAPGQTTETKPTRNPVKAPAIAKAPVPQALPKGALHP